MLRRPYRPSRGENRMRHEGDVSRARAYYFDGAPENLRFLLEQRFAWMNRFIGPGDAGVEVGCGTGLSKEFLRAGTYLLTDLADYDWLDVTQVDALATPFSVGQFDFVVSSNMIHHVPRPLQFFREMARILKPGGRLIIQEINASLAMRVLLRLMRHEGYSFAPDVYDEATICTDASDPWSANCAIPNLLFDDLEQFEREVPAFRAIHHAYRECLSLVNSGGVIAKTACIPLPRPLLNLVGGVDRVLSGLMPGVFALQRQIVLERRPGVSDALVEPRAA